MTLELSDAESPDPGFEGYSFPAQLEVDWKKSVKALSLSRSWTLVGFRFKV